MKHLNGFIVLLTFLIAWGGLGMSLPIDRTAKAALDANLVNGVTSDAPKLKANNDVLYNTMDELYTYAGNLYQSGISGRTIYDQYLGAKGDLSASLQKDGFTTVITGDSLSYNAYGFMSTIPANAYEAYPGIGSWSFLLRDAIHRNDPYFVHADDIKFRNIKNTSDFSVSDALPYTFPFNNRFLTMEIRDNAEEVIIPYIHHSNNNKAVLYLGSNPNNTACSFDIYVNGVYATSVNNNGEGKTYQGFEPLYIEIPFANGAVREIKLTNFQQTASNPEGSGLMKVYLLGIGSKYSPVYLTGSGGKTANWLATNLAERVTNYNPDLVVIIIGANDRVSRTVEQFRADLTNVVNGIRLANAKTSIMLISPPSSQDPNNPNTDNATYVPDEKTYKYINVMKDIAVQYGTYFMDLVELFKDIPYSDWRHDNVHFTRYGNTFLARSVIKMIMPESVHDKNMVDASQSWNNGVPHHPIEQIHGWAIIQWNAGTSQYVIVSQSPENAVSSVERVNAYTVRVHFKYGVGASGWNGFIYGVTSSQYGNVTNVINTRPYDYGLNYHSFVTFKNGSLTTDSDYANAPQDFKFQISF